MGRGIAHLGLILGSWWLATASSCAEPPTWEGLRRSDGSTVPGTLVTRENGGWALATATERVPLEQFHWLRSGQKLLPARLVKPLEQRYRLPGEQSIIGVLKQLDGKHLTLETAWADTLTLPRSAVELVEPVDAARPIIWENFATKPMRLVSGKTVLEQQLPDELRAGRVDLILQIPEGTEAGCGEVGLAAKAGKLLQVTIPQVGQPYAIATKRPAKSSFRWRVAAGKHRLTFEWNQEVLLVLVDDLVIWIGDGLDENGLPRTVEVQGQGEGTKPIELLHLVVEREETERWLPFSNRQQDEIITPAGDQWFGRLAKQTSKGVQQRSRLGPRDWAWTDVRALRFRRGAFQPATTQGTHVRLVLATRDGREHELAGVLTAVEPDRLRLEHAILGKLAIPFGFVNAIAPQFAGERRVLLAQPVHLGKELKPRFQMPRAKGRTLKYSFGLEAVPATATVIVVGRPAAKEATLELYINDRRQGLPRRLGLGIPVRWEVPSRVLKVGVNRLRLEQDRADLEIDELRLELSS